MVKSVIGLVGGATLALVGGIAPVEAASAPSPETDLKPARSFAELLDPVPNASATLKALNEKEPASLEMAQYYNYGYGGGYGYHHHHHHHHRWGWRHHHHGWGWRGGYHHHHHHHRYW